MDTLRSVEDVLARVAMFSGRVVEHRRLAGGLSHQIWLVTCGGRTYVLRVLDPAVSAAGLGVPPAQEITNTLRAAESGVGARVYEVLPDVPALVLEFLPGRTLSAGDVRSPATGIRIAEACRRLHAGPSFVSDFDMFEVQRRYLAIVQEFGFRLPPDYLTFVPAVRRIEAALRATAGPPVPCHNDLLAANIMDDGERLWLIDFEYSGNNDPCFELGNVWSEAALPPDRLEHLVGAYFGAPSPLQTARARLYALMAKYGWTLWASIQDAVSDVDFDFWDWGMEKYARACAEFRGPGFEQLLTTIRESDRIEGAEPWPSPAHH